jgi:lipopolysaccharide transport system permease protein
MLQLWMYATPIVYSVSMIPERWHWLYNLNPMVGLIEAFRWSLLGQGEIDMSAIATGLAITVVLLIGGSAFFRRAERLFADIL